ncbi:MAG: BamA/TamA family outer membrane protein [Bacteroidetes bacterium]|nr:BamA/TamA family outer membrane protein [Bacteroidota bacterium]
MTKLRLYGFTLVLLLLSCVCGFSQYKLKVICVDRDSVFDQKNIGLQSDFKTKDACIEYIYKIPSMIRAKGFATASIDSIHVDSLQADVRLYIGDTYRWGHISTKPEDAMILNNSGWNEKKISNKLLNFAEIQNVQQQMLNYMENNGYPFAKISLDSILLADGILTAGLKIDKGPLYKIDSIRVYGTAKISDDFLQRYLSIRNGSIYRKERLQQISRKIRELPYLQEEHSWNLTLLGTGSILNLYLKPRKSSQVDVLIGLLPNNDQLTNNRLLVTGEATVNLKNPFGNGESIGLNWQQIQPKSPRLNLYFQQPYIFKSPFGLNVAFDLFKKDSSYININALLGVQYTTSATKTASVFIQSATSNLLNVDTALVIATHALPSEADVTAVNLGLTYDFNNTNYRFNPLRGNELQLVGMVGTKKIRKNNEIVKLSDPNDANFSFNSLYDTVKLNSYEFRVKLIAAHYFQLGRASTLKLGANGGVFQSPNTFRNEAFQIGGYKLLRGFDEESILAVQYAVGTLEYRYLIAQNSFLFSFVDYGWAKNNITGYNLNNTYLGFGMGLAFETKAGVFNISYAIGKRDDANLNLRQAKIHLGYVNYF